MTPVEFRGDLWHQKTRLRELSSGVVCVILCLAVLLELRLVPDRHRQTQAHGYLSTARYSGGQTGEWALVQEEQMGPLLTPEKFH